MTLFLTLFVITIFAVVIRLLISFNSLSLLILKNKEVAQKDNKLERRHQFIKGLY
jgi:hypothetical protein